MKMLFIAFILVMTTSASAHNLVANSILERQKVLTKELAHDNCELREITTDYRLGNLSNITDLLANKGYKFDPSLIMPDQPLFNNAYIIFADESKTNGIKLDILLPAQKGLLSYLGNLVINLENITARESFSFGGLESSFEIEVSLMQLIEKLPRCVVKN